LFILEILLYGAEIVLVSSIDPDALAKNVPPPLTGGGQGVGATATC
jgi:hypothetical protein